MRTGVTIGGTERRTRAAVDPDGTDLPYLAGAAAGVGAAILGYLVTLLWVAPRVLDVVVRHAGRCSIARDALPRHAAGLPVWKAAGRLFYDAHGVGVRFVEAGHRRANYLDFVASERGTLASLFLVPPALLLLAGAFAAMGGVAAAVLSVTPAAKRTADSPDR